MRLYVILIEEVSTAGELAVTTGTMLALALVTMREVASNLVDARVGKVASFSPLIIFGKNVVLRTKLVTVFEVLSFVAR